MIIEKTPIQKSAKKRSVFHSFSIIAVAVFGMLMATALDSEAGDKEIWYDSKGQPILIKDKTTGKMRALTAEEKSLIAKHSNTAQTPFVPTNTEPAPASAPQPAPVEQSNNQSLIPLSLNPRLYDSSRISPYGRSYISPYSYGGYSHYPYSRQVIPRFSNNGYYGPARYRPSCYGSYGSYGYGHYHRSGGLYLQYSRPGFTIRGRF